MSHTPGPWRLRRDDDEFPWIIEGPDAFPVAILAGLRQPAEVNARLIAAAPEMYEVLRSYAYGCHACGGDPLIVRPDLTPSDYVCRECAAARDVIAKAEGRQP